MADFVLEISGSGGTIRLDPVGTIDAAAARTLLDVLVTLHEDRHTTAVEIRADRVAGVTAEALAVLVASPFPVDALVSAAAA
jgi:hypothetical protein